MIVCLLMLAITPKKSLSLAAVKVTYIRAVPKGYLYAEAHKLVNHHRLPYGQVKLTDEAGRLCAVFSTSAYRKDSKY